MKIDYDRVLKRNPLTHSRVYPTSYYAASANSHSAYPALEKNVDCDVCIIGGGFSGVNCALELAERGIDVCLLEARRIGWGASGRNGGQVLHGIGQNNQKFHSIIGQKGIDQLEEMGDEGIEILLNRAKKYDIKCDVKRGSTLVALKKRHLQEFDAYQKHFENRKYPFSIIRHDAKNLHEAIGSKRYIGALSLGGDAHIHPLNLCLGEADAASSLGVKLFENSAVEKIEEGESIRVHTERGSVKANVLVMCCNAYGSNLHNRISNKILPAGSYIIATEPLSEQQANELLPLDSAVCDLNYALDYFRLSADKRLLFGGMCNYSGRDPVDIKSVLRPKMLRVFPQLERVGIDYQWGGMIGVGINRLPQVGRTSPNVYHAQAYAGHGVNATHLTARVIAESITGESRRIELFESIKHWGFPGGKLLQSPLFAIGMAYFRMKDAF